MSELAGYQIAALGEHVNQIGPAAARLEAAARQLSYAAERLERERIELSAVADRLERERQQLQDTEARLSTPFDAGSDALNAALDRLKATVWREGSYDGAEKAHPYIFDVLKASGRMPVEGEPR